MGLGLEQQGWWNWQGKTKSETVGGEKTIEKALMYKFWRKCNCDSLPDVSLCTAVINQQMSHTSRTPDSNKQGRKNTEKGNTGGKGEMEQLSAAACCSSSGNNILLFVYVTPVSKNA